MSAKKKAKRKVAKKKAKRKITEKKKKNGKGPGR